ncbi:flagellar export chaperone FliS [Salinisphaera sp. T31B1]|uniref:flagellar export chaperone FliS n=1 Tax=Salinisphaera sp. T31B1 TaxID=727963 RepID=UPI00333F5F77
MHARQAAHAYAHVGLQTGAMSASPHQLIVMLFDGTHAALKKSQWAIANNDLAAKGRTLSKAIDIIERGLRAALDFERGGEIAQRLDSLYDYMVRTLMRANLHSDATLVAEVDTLLTDISSAWKQIGHVAAPAVPA